MKTFHTTHNVLIYVSMYIANSFPRTAEFQAELRILPFAVEFPHFCGILQNLTKWPVTDVIASNLVRIWG